MADDPHGDSLYVAVSEDEREKIRQTLREQKWEIETRKYNQWLEGAKIFSAQIFAARMALLTASTDYGKVFVRSLFILNGGALLAALSFVSSLYGKGDSTMKIAVAVSAKIYPALFWFSGGLICGAILAAIGYWNFQIALRSQMDETHLFRMIVSSNLYAGVSESEQQKDMRFAEMADKAVEISYWTAIAIGIASLAFFLIGLKQIAAGVRIMGLFAGQI